MVYIAVDVVVEKLAAEYGWDEERKGNCRTLLEVEASKIRESESDALNGPLEMCPGGQRAMRPYNWFILRRQTKDAIWYLAMTKKELEELPGRLKWI